MDQSVDHRAVAKTPHAGWRAPLSSDLARPQWSLTRAAGTPVTVGETGCVKSEATEQRTTRVRRRNKNFADSRFTLLRFCGRSGYQTQPFKRVSSSAKNIPRANFLREDLADKDKRRPVVRVRIFFADFEHCGAQRLGFIVLGHETVEQFHQLGGTTVIHIP